VTARTGGISVVRFRPVPSQGINERLKGFERGVEAHTRIRGITILSSMQLSLILVAAVGVSAQYVENLGKSNYTYNSRLIAPVGVPLPRATPGGLQPAPVAIRPTPIIARPTPIAAAPTTTSQCTVNVFRKPSFARVCTQYQHTVSYTVYTDCHGCELRTLALGVGLVSTTTTRVSQADKIQPCRVVKTVPGATATPVTACRPPLPTKRPPF
jgi:hypothetical protein